MPVVEEVSAEEWAAGKIGAAKLQQLVATFHEQGLAVLGNAVPSDVLEMLAPRMASDAAAIVAHGGFAARGEFGKGHLQLGPPRVRRVTSRCRRH